jgi:hypothetical protein
VKILLWFPVAGSSLLRGPHIALSFSTPRVASNVGTRAPISADLEDIAKYRTNSKRSRLRSYPPGNASFHHSSCGRRRALEVRGTSAVPPRLIPSVRDRCDCRQRRRPCDCGDVALIVVVSSLLLVGRRIVDDQATRVIITGGRRVSSLSVTGDGSIPSRVHLKGFRIAPRRN